MDPAQTHSRISTLDLPARSGSQCEICLQAAPVSGLRRRAVRAIVRCLFFGLLIFATHIAATAQFLRREPFGLRDSTQLIIVTSPGWNSTTGELLRFERATTGATWKTVGHPIAVNLGKNGMAWDTATEIADTQGAQDPSDPLKTEGDLRSPAGIFRLGRTFGYAPNRPPGWRMPYKQLTATVECVDDPASKFYNQILDRGTATPDWKSSETMLRSDDLYQWGLVIDQNTEQPQPGKGSCNFLHVWAGPGQATVGCTSTAEEQMEHILGWLDPDQNPVLVELPRSSYAALQSSWGLPPVP